MIPSAAPVRTRTRAPGSWPVGLLLCLTACMQGGLMPQQPAATGEQASDALPAATIPSGVVVAFAGKAVPPGWTVCDGRTTPTGLQTPDLRSRFILGTTPDDREAGSEAGAETHTHAAWAGEPKGGRTPVDSDNDAFVASDEHTHGVSVREASHLPPCVKLVYLMRD